MTFPSEIPSAVTEAECHLLEDLARDADVIEFGAHFGRSTVVMGLVARSLVSVDWHRGDQHAGFGDSLHAYLANLDRYGLREKVVTVVARFEHLRGWPRVYDLAFLDGHHEVDSVRRDLALLSTLIRPGGAIACHDATAPHFGVGTAFEEHLRTYGGMIVQQVETVKVLRLP